MPEGASPEVRVNGAAAPAELIGQPRKFNPGHYVIVAKAAAAEGKEEVDLAEKDKKEVTVALTVPVVHANPGDVASAPIDEPPPHTGRSGGSLVLILRRLWSRRAPGSRPG